MARPMTFSKELFNQWLKDNKRDVIITGKFVKMVVNAEFTCLRCNHEFSQKPYYVKRRSSHVCPNCNNCLPWTVERVIQTLAEKNSTVTFVGPLPPNQTTKTTFNCTVCHENFDTTIECTCRRLSACPKCNTQFKWTKERILQTLIEKNPTIEFLGPLPEKYNLFLKTMWRCRDCNFEFENSIELICYHLSGCPQCNKCERWTKERLIQRLAEKNHTLELIDPIPDYLNVETHVHIRCRRCNHHYTPNIKSICNSLSACPLCNAVENKPNEMRTKFYLEQLLTPQANLIWQHPISNEVDQPTDRFTCDFFFTNNDQKYILEYNGPQHYEPYELFGGVEKFEQQKIRDHWLEHVYCPRHDIKFLSIDGRKVKDLKIWKALLKLLKKNKIPLNPIPSPPLYPILPPEIPIEPTTTNLGTQDLFP